MTHQQLRNELRGNIVPLPAQFKDDLSLNSDGYVKHLDFLLSHDVKNIYLALSASEFEFMSLKERLKVTEITVKRAKGKAIVLAQPIGGGCIKDFISETTAMVDLGADAVVIKPIPLKEEMKFFSTFYRKRSYASIKDSADNFIVDFYQTIAKETGASIIIHDKPFRSFEVIERIIKIDNIIGYKSHESTPWVRQEVFRRFGERIVCFDALGKTDQFWSFTWGAKARHTCWSWFDPKRDQRFVDLIKKGDMKAAVDLVNEEWEFVNAILETGFHGYKMAMELMGLPGGPVRIPGQIMGPQGKEIIKKAMKGMGYF